MTLRRARGGGGWALVVVLGLVGCGATPSADAGATGDGGLGAGGLDAGRVDGGRGDAGRADAGPEEPRLSSAILYKDEFDAWASTGELLSAYPDSRQVRGALALDTGALRVDYAADGGCGDADVFVAKSFDGDVPTVIVTTSLRVPVDYRFAQPATHCAGAGTGAAEFVLSRLNDAPGQLALEARQGSEGLLFQVRLGSLVLPQQAWRVERGPASLADDGWHRLTLLVTRESAVGAGDGVVRVWVDGVAVLEAERAATGTAPFRRLSVPGPLTAGAAEPQSRWTDDVAVFTP